MNDDAPEDGDSPSFRARKRTRRAKRRRALRVPVDEVPRRSLGDEILDSSPGIDVSSVEPREGRARVTTLLDELAPPHSDSSELLELSEADLRATPELETPEVSLADLPGVPTVPGVLFDDSVVSRPPSEAPSAIAEPRAEATRPPSERAVEPASDRPRTPAPAAEPAAEIPRRTSSLPPSAVLVRGTVRVSSTPRTGIRMIDIDPPLPEDDEESGDAPAQEGRAPLEPIRPPPGSGTVELADLADLEVTSASEVGAIEAPPTDQSEDVPSELEGVATIARHREDWASPTEPASIEPLLEIDPDDREIGVPDDAFADDPLLSDAALDALANDAAKVGVEELEVRDADDIGLEEDDAQSSRAAAEATPEARPSLPQELDDADLLVAEAAVEQRDSEAPREEKRARKKARPWFETFFNDDYLRTVPPPPARHIRRQCDFIEVTLGLEAGATILDAGCGMGAHAVDLASRGYRVVGLDLSLPMLSRASDEAQERSLQINFLHTDMREMTFEGAFDAILSWNTSFGYFDDDGNRDVVRRLRDALKPGGVLLMDVVNRDYVIRNQPNLVWFEGDGCVCMEETQFNNIKSRLEVKRTVILDDNRQRESYYSIRLYSFHELGQLLHQQGFRVASVSAHELLPGVFFGPDSPRMIVLAERRADMMPSRERALSSSSMLAVSPPPAPRISEKVPPPPPDGERESVEEIDPTELEPEA